MTVSKQLCDIPKDYFLPCSKAGRLEVLKYRTYESFSYTSSQPIPLEKEAIVYLPYGYTENQS